MIFFLFISFTLWLIWRVYSFFAYRRRSYDGKTVLITGATSEVGRRLCFRFHGLNARIIAWDSSKSRLEELQRDVLSYYRARPDAASGMEESSSPTSTSEAAMSSGSSATAGTSKTVPSLVIPTRTATTTTAAAAAAASRRASSESFAVKEEDTFIVQTVDLGTRTTVQRASRELLSAGFVPDVILHAAHTCPSKSFLERPDDAMEKVMFVNTLAPLWIAKIMVPAMLEKKTGCQIVHFATSAGDQCVSPRDAPDYIASEWGLVGAHYALRRWVNGQKHAWTGASTAASSSVTSSSTIGAAARGRPATAAVGSSGQASSNSGIHPTTPVGDIRVCLVRLRDIQISSPSIYSIPYAAERGLAREELESTAGVASPRRAGSLSARGSGGASGGGIVSGSAANGAEANLSPSQLASREAKRMDAVTDRAIRAIVHGVERYTDSAMSAVYPFLEVLPVPWYAKIIQWCEK